MSGMPIRSAAHHEADGRLCFVQVTMKSCVDKPALPIVHGSNGDSLAGIALTAKTLVGLSGVHAK